MRGKPMLGQAVSGIPAEFMVAVTKDKRIIRCPVRMDDFINRPSSIPIVICVEPEGFRDRNAQGRRLARAATQQDIARLCAER